MQRSGIETEMTGQSDLLRKRLHGSRLQTRRGGSKLGAVRLSLSEWPPKGGGGEPAQQQETKDGAALVEVGRIPSSETSKATSRTQHFQKHLSEERTADKWLEEQLTDQKPPAGIPSLNLRALKISEAGKAPGAKEGAERRPLVPGLNLTSSGGPQSFVDSLTPRSRTSLQTTAQELVDMISKVGFKASDSISKLAERFDRSVMGVLEQLLPPMPDATAAERASRPASAAAATQGGGAARHATEEATESLPKKGRRHSDPHDPGWGLGGRQQEGRRGGEGGGEADAEPQQQQRGVALPHLVNKLMQMLPVQPQGAEADQQSGRSAANRSARRQLQRAGACRSNRRTPRAVATTQAAGDASGAEPPQALLDKYTQLEAQCTQLRDKLQTVAAENRELKHTCELDEQVRVQLETLLADKARLVQENNLLSKENTSLQELLNYSMACVPSAAADATPPLLESTSAWTSPVCTPDKLQPARLQPRLQLSSPSPPRALSTARNPPQPSPFAEWAADAASRAAPPLQPCAAAAACTDPRSAAAPPQPCRTRSPEAPPVIRRAPASSRSRCDGAVAAGHSGASSDTSSCSSGSSFGEPHPSGKENALCAAIDAPGCDDKALLLPGRCTTAKLPPPRHPLLHTQGRGWLPPAM